jgi:hypothetical protein
MNTAAEKRIDKETGGSNLCVERRMSMIHYPAFLSPVEAGYMTLELLFARFLTHKLYMQGTCQYAGEMVNVRPLDLHTTITGGWTDPIRRTAQINWLRRIHKDHDFYLAGATYKEGDMNLFVVECDPDFQDMRVLFCACYLESDNENKVRNLFKNLTAGKTGARESLHNVPLHQDENLIELHATQQMEREASDVSTH